ncbi:MAG: GIY-YIG nuclease family protein [Candidatus Dojkabacteria bacterium]
MFFVYILYNSTIDKFYIGYTSNLESRIQDHNSQGHKSKYTRKQIGEWEIVYKEEFSDKTTALRRENEIKSKKSKIYIQRLIESSPA